MPTRQTALPSVALALLLAGCGISNPYAQHSSSAPPSRATGTSTGSRTPSTSPDDPSDRPAGSYPPARLVTGAVSGVGTTGSDGATTAQGALERYARLDINWTSQTVGATQRRLAAISIGQARATALQAAATYSHDIVLLNSHVTNTGAVVSVAQSQTAPGVWVVVTSEHTAGSGDYAGLPPQLHITYARVTHTPTGFLVSTWSAQT